MQRVVQNNTVVKLFISFDSLECFLIVCNKNYTNFFIVDLKTSHIFIVLSYKHCYNIIQYKPIIIVFQDILFYYIFYTLSQ